VSDLYEELINALDLDRLGLSEDSLSSQLRQSNVIELGSKIHDNDDGNRAEYDADQSVEFYRNFLDWLFATFRVSEAEFRRQSLAALALKPGDRVLVTSCGLGEDVAAWLDHIGDTGFVHAQDLSGVFVQHASARTKADNVAFTISNALDLPYRDNYFDAVYHFGGINLFGDLPLAVREMTRVCKIGGRVVFGDESVAPHLRDDDYGKMFIENNALWSAPLPLKDLPLNALDVEVRYLLGNCFYQIAFCKGEGLPDVDIDVAHIGHRGGSVRTRYFGALEGVSDTAKTKVHEYARSQNLSVSETLERLIAKLDEG
jgi:SAM-dependent methyltransferase